MQYITDKQSGTTRMTTTKAYDNLNRLTSISSAAGSTVLDSHGYGYNSANQRTSVTNVDGSYFVYQYDSLGQVTSGTKYWSDGSVVAGQQFGYGFDTIGNRTGTSAGGDQWGANLRYASYTANNLNQLASQARHKLVSPQDTYAARTVVTSRTVPMQVSVLDIYTLNWASELSRTAPASHIRALPIRRWCNTLPANKAARRA